MLTRRRLINVGPLSICFLNIGSCDCFARSSRTPNTFGCKLAASDVESIYPTSTETRRYINGKEPMIPRSGDKDFDRALARTLSRVSDTLQVTPGFAYYNDIGDPHGLNAYATDVRRLENIDGTVLFGLGLLKEMMAGDMHPEVSVAAICAHEFGHILQFQKDLWFVDDGLPIINGVRAVKRSELQADFFAGYFAAKRRAEKPDFPAFVFGTTMEKLGDTAYHSAGHHGTPKERGDAIIKGFEVGHKEKRSLADAIQISINYVKNIKFRP